MKKIIIFFVLAAMLCVGMTSFADELSPVVVNTYADLDFEDGAVPSSYFYDFNDNTQGGYGISTEDGTLKVSTMAEEITYKGSTFVVGSAGHSWQMVFPGEHLDGKCTNMFVTLEYDIKFESFPFINRLFFLKGNDNKEVYNITVDTNGKLGGIWPAVYENDVLSANTWYNIRFVFDLKNGNYDFFIDGNTVFSDRALPEGLNDIKYFNLPRFMGYSSDSYSTFYLDDIKLFSSANPYTVSAYQVSDGSETEGLDSFPILGGKIKLAFSEEMREITKENFIFKVNGAEADFDIEFDSGGKKAVTITPKKEFTGREKCLLQIKDAFTVFGAEIFGEDTFEFDVASPDYGILSCEISEIIPGEDAEVSVTVKNHTGVSKQGLIIIGLTDARGRMISKASQVTESTDDENQNYTLNLKIPSDYNSENFKIVAYLATRNDFYELDRVLVE